MRIDGVNDMRDDASILLTSISGPIAALTLNQPKKRNSLSLNMLRALKESIEKLGSRHEIRVIILRANGSAFCAGHDLKEMTRARTNADGGRGFFEETMSLCSETMQAIVRCPKPVIASVQGTATAAGCQLVASCDLALAAENAQFATPGVNIGLFCSTPMVALTRNIGRKQSMQMLLTGELISADTAADWGLLNQVVPEDRLHDETVALANTLASKSAATLRIGKEAFYAQLEFDLSDAYDYAAKVMVENMMIEDAREGIEAFLEKRSPTWGSC